MISSTLIKQYLICMNKYTGFQKLKCIQWMNRKAMAQEAYCPTAVEHIANIITHGIWIIPSFMGTLKLVNRSRDDNQLLSAVVYGFTLVSLFVISTFFHCVFYCNSFRYLKDILHRCDRAMIYVFIAGSYFPWLTLEQLPDESWASQMKWIVWLLAILGIMYQQIFHEKYKRLETIFYVVMGVGPVLLILNEHYFLGMKELTMGGIFYTLGILFFKCDGVIPFAHAIWHLFVVMAVYFHYCAILNYLYPIIML